ncbi:type II toxin-antitoxin system VapC family toxin [Nesterenkonia muleiensis]|uniref:type II toxin-antitoxin system VapC family toxin n=1 Tax=Nesterenkonia muleiensis TaxID=2282648 RepID=UPI0013003377|nr:type II toxin-antitoxin system VapC family toxin [Nesterenkonia muleiensis]
MDAQNSAELHLSVITVLEIRIGILKAARKDSDRAARLRQRYEQRVLTGFSGRILPVDLEVGEAAAPCVPKTASAHDALIAGTALARGFALVIRNVKDFQGRGVRLINPWGANQP